MRFLLTLMLALILSGSVYAQDKKPAPLPSTSNQEAPLQDPTAEQLREAKNVLQTCNNDEILNQRHNCKCYSVQFLEKRIQMGDTVNRAEIINALNNACLKEAQEQSETSSYKDMSEISKEDLEEAEFVYQECKKNWRMRTYHDCKCIAGKFIDDRQIEGPLVGYESIIAKYQNACKNEVDLAGYKFTDCMENSKQMAPQDALTTEVRPFCECLAREYVRGNNRVQRRTADTEPNLNATSKAICRKKMMETRSKKP